MTATRQRPQKRLRPPQHPQRPRPRPAPQRPSCTCPAGTKSCLPFYLRGFHCAPATLTFRCFTRCHRCPPVRECFCKHGAEHYYEYDDEGCPRYAIVLRRPILHAGLPERPSHSTPESPSLHLAVAAARLSLRAPRRQRVRKPQHRRANAARRPRATVAPTASSTTPMRAAARSHAPATGPAPRRQQPLLPPAHLRNSASRPPPRRLRPATRARAPL